MGYSIRYVAAGGGDVDVSFPIKPYEVLGVPSTASIGEIKQAFRNKINQPSRQSRAMVSIASHILTSTVGRYKREPGNKFSFSPILNPNPKILAAAATISAIFGNNFMLAAAGHTERLDKRTSDINTIDEADEHKRTLLYLACKSGFYDTSNLLLSKGASVNKIQVDGSTPLHVAAYYGHTLVVGLLLEYGAATNIENRFEHTALVESRTDEIQALIQNASKDHIYSLTAQLKEKGLVTRVRLVEYKGEEIGKELIRDPTSLDELTQEEWDEISESWECVWHGTRYENLLSIFENGLLPAGSKGIEPLDGHIDLDQKVFGIENWAAAIFVSPSIMYAGHAAYAERVFSESKRWCVLVKALCKPESYKAYDPTTFPPRVPAEGEPDKPEYRVPVTDADKHKIFRVECSRSVVVRSVIFVSLSFLESVHISFEEALKMFA